MTLYPASPTLISLRNGLLVLEETTQAEHKWLLMKADNKRETLTLGLYLPSPSEDLNF